MNQDCLKLTTYFGERDRNGDRLLADALLDVYGAHDVRASVLLRGVEGFGLAHHMHTDRLLSLSEDLPAVSVAVDTRARIEALIDDVLRVKRRGLLTLERARLLTGETEADAELPEAVKLTVYVGRQERVGRRPAFVTVCDLLRRRGVDGATVLLGVDGTRHGRRERARFFAGNAQVPMMIIAVGSGERIGAVLPELGAMLSEPLVTLERVLVCKRDGHLLARPHALPAEDEQGLGLWQKLMVYSSEAAVNGGLPLHRVLVRRLRQSQAAGATTLRGMWGFHGNHAPHGDKLLQVRRHVPVVTVIIDRPARIAEAFEIVDEVTSQTGVVTSEMVPALSVVAGDERRGGLRLARHRF